MYAGFVVLFPFLWVGALSDMGVLMAGHVLMPRLMLPAMLARCGDCTDQQMSAACSKVVFGSEEWDGDPHRGWCR
jgi:hypothetical protein